MVVGIGVRDSKPDGHLVEESDCGIGMTDRRKIVAETEDELVEPGAQFIARSRTSFSGWMR